MNLWIVILMLAGTLAIAEYLCRRGLKKEREEVAFELLHLRKVRAAARRFISDLHRRYPGEEMDCPFIRDIETTLVGGNAL